MTITLRKNKPGPLTWNELDNNFTTLRDTPPPPQFLNVRPTVGLPANRDAVDQIPVYADFTFSRKESYTPSPLMVDREDQEIMFVRATNGKVQPQVYRAARSSNTQPFIFSNIPMRTPWMAANEVMANVLNLSTNSAYISVYNTSTSAYRYYVVKIQGNSHPNMWTDYIEVTADAAAHAYAAYLYDPVSDRIISMYQVGLYQKWLRILTPSLVEVRPDQLLFDCRYDVNWVDHTGVKHVDLNNTRMAYVLEVLPFTYDAAHELLYFGGDISSPYTVAGGVTTYIVYNMFSTWSLPKSVLVNNTGSFVNLVPYNRENTSNYDIWNETSVGLWRYLTGNTTGLNMGFDDYYKAVYVNANPYWDNGSQISTIKLSVPTRTINLNTATAEYQAVVSIPDASMWAKSVNQCMWLMDDTMQFGGVDSGGVSTLQVKISPSQFDTSYTTNDTIRIIPNTEQRVRVAYTATEYALLERVAKLCTIVGLDNQPTYYMCAQPGTPIYRVSLDANGHKHLNDTGIVLPALQTTYTWYNSWGWDGNVASPTFYYFVSPNNQPVQTQNYARLLKHNAGVWTVSPTVPCLDYWDGSRAGRGIASIAASYGMTYTMSSQRLAFGVSVASEGGRWPGAITTMKPDMSFTPPFPVDDAYTQEEVYSDLVISYHSLYGYYISNSSLSLGGGKAANIRTSKNYGVDSQSFTEAEFFEQGKKFLRYITIAPATGLIAYILPYPLFLGGYFSYIPKMDVPLVANSVNYVYLRRSPTDPTQIAVLVLQNQLLPNSFSRVLAAKVTTNATAVVTAEMVPL